MKRTLAAVAALVTAGVLATTGLAGGSVSYYSSFYWTPGMGGSSAYSTLWYKSGFAKAYGFDTTVTFIDNTGYNWHSTVRGYQTNQYSYWLSSTVKKAHCRSNAHAKASIQSVCYATY